MTSPTKQPVFLEKDRYRQRRLRDAARMLPLLGIILWAIPLLWSHEPATGEGPSESTTLVYVFVVWVGLIVLSAVISYFLRQDDDDLNPPTEDETT